MFRYWWWIKRRRAKQNSGGMQDTAARSLLDTALRFLADTVGAGGAADPKLDFSLAANSQYVALMF
jgi:hypothetical protein